MSRILPALGLLVGVAGFSFQILILNPWHYMISKQIKQIENKVDNIDKTLKSRTP